MTSLIQHMACLTECLSLISCMWGQIGYRSVKSTLELLTCFTPYLGLYVARALHRDYLGPRTTYPGHRVSEARTELSGTLVRAVRAVA